MQQVTTTIRIKAETAARINRLNSWGSWDAKLNYILDEAERARRRPGNTTEEEV